MFVVRQFLVSPAFARLIGRERTGSTRIVEGYFTPHSNRTHLVRVAEGRATLVLASRVGEVADEVEVPLAHAEALMEVAAGRVAFDRFTLPLGATHPAMLDRFLLPTGVSIVTLLTESEAEAELAWLGPEVTGEHEFTPEALALSGPPSMEEVVATNAGLEALIDVLDGRLPFGRIAPPDPGNSAEAVAVEQHAEPATATPKFGLRRVS